jgi:uncharacterized damage-inducible protein DinB
MEQQTMTELGMYLAGFEREYQTTLKLLKGYPANKSELKPSEKSASARELVFTLAMVQAVAGVAATQDELVEPPVFKAPPTWAEVVGVFEHMHADSLAKLKKLTEAEFNAPFKLLAGPGGKTATMRRADVLWFFTMDHVHHRGQFSVYMRIAGAKVPSIYGPSGDEPWA